jgi:DNA-directed RNA polymerase specialized sigma24 family protein
LKREPYDRLSIAAWELTRIKLVARRFRTTERDDLEAELARQLLVLKVRSAGHVRDWNAYLMKFLYNKAINWVRRSRAARRRNAALVKSHVTIDGLPDRFASATRSRVDLTIAFAAVWNDLDPKARTLCRLLLEGPSSGKAQLARHLGVHRNTVHVWVAKVRRILLRHGFTGTESWD